MSLFDQPGQAAGGMLGGGGNQNPLLQADIVNSWVSTGQHLPVSAQQIKQGLGGDMLNQVASKAGLSPDAAGSQLAGLLPDLIDKLTPNGKIEAGGLDQLMKMVQGK